MKKPVVTPIIPFGGVGKPTLPEEGWCICKEDFYGENYNKSWHKKTVNGAF